MKELKTNKKVILIIAIILIIALLVSTIIIINNNNNNKNTDNNTNQTNNNISNSITGTSLEEVNINSNEIKELYNYLKPNIKGGACTGFYYANPYKNYTTDKKIELVLYNYVENFKKEITNNMWEKMPEDERTLLKNNGVTKYVEESTIKEGMKLFFNIDIDNFDKKSYANYTYNQDLKIFIEGMSGNGYPATVEQQIIDYQESSEEITLTTVKAEITSNKEVYRYVNNKDTLVYKDLTEEFKFTNDNIEKFPQLKYVFKKNNEGKYYLNDIINLNFEEDFIQCN